MSRSRDIANLLGSGSIILDGAPSALDTLDELAAALGDDANYASTITTALNNRVLKTGGDTITVESGTTVPLTIQNNGTGNSFVVNDVASDTSPFVIDASGNVGIGQPSPQNSLDVSGIISSRNTSEWNIRSVSTGTTSTNRNHFIAQRANGSSAVTSGFNLGGLTMAGFDGTNYSFGWNGGAEITAYATETWTSTARGTSVAISTTANGSNSSTERLRIDSSGNVGIGITPNAKLDISAPGVNPLTVRMDNYYYVNFGANQNSSQIGLSLTLKDSSGATQTGYIYGTAGSNPLMAFMAPGSNNGILLFGNNNGSGALNEYMRIESSGRVKLPAGGVLEAPVSTNAQTGTGYTLVLADAGKVIEMNNAAANTLTVPTDASVNFPVGTVIDIFQTGAGQTTVGGAGVTINARPGLKLSGQWATATLIKRSANTWLLTGSLSA